MATLPAGWVADYDGQRWFFKYAATNHIQYHFPKPGDEFPDFAGFCGGFEALGLTGVLPAAELLPEERLESERQVRRHETLDSGSNNNNNNNNSGCRSKSKSTRKRQPKAQEHEHEHEHELGEGMFSFESFGYLGPGSYLDAAVSPVTDRASVHQGAKAESLASLGGVSSLTPPPSVRMVSNPPVSAGEPPALAIQPVAAAQLHPPCRASPAQTVTAGPPTPVPTRTAQPQPPPPPPPPPAPPAPEMIHMLDGREVLPSPVGHIAELVSESTARCLEEICPTPVELPDNGASWLEPVPVPNLVNQYPVELPALELERPRKTGGEQAARWDEKRPEENCASSGAHVQKQQQQQQQQQEPFRAHGKKGSSHPRDGTRNSMADLNLMSPGGQSRSSIKPQPQSPPRPPKVESLSDLPSRQAQAPQIPPKIPHDERLRQEILGFFPEDSGIPRALQIGAAKPASAPIPETEVRRLSMSSSSGAKLGPVPSILRPGPRRPSQPPVPVGLRPGNGMHATSTPPPKSTATYRPYQPSGPLKVPAAGGAHSPPTGDGPHVSAVRQCAPLRPQSLASAAGRTQSSPEVQRPHGGSADREVRCYQPLRPQKPTARPHAQSLAERRDPPPAPRGADAPAVIPDPGHRARALRLVRSSTLPAMEEELSSLASCSPSPSHQQAAATSSSRRGDNPRASMYFAPGGHGKGQVRSSPVKFAVPAAAAAAAAAATAAPQNPPGDAHREQQPGPGPDREPSSFVRMPSARDSLVAAAAPRPIPPLKMPSEPAVPTGGGGVGGSVPGVDERRFTSFSQLEGAGVPGDKRLKNMLGRVASPGGVGEGGGGGASAAGGAEPVWVAGGEGAGHSPMGYIPPKGKRGEAAEWSWGHAE